MKVKTKMTDDLKDRLRKIDSMEEAWFAIEEAADAIEELGEENKRLTFAEHRSVMANVRLGKWMSAALDDPSVCDEMKADIREWFSSGPPPHALAKIGGDA